MPKIDNLMEEIKVFCYSLGFKDELQINLLAFKNFYKWTPELQYIFKLYEPRDKEGKIIKVVEDYKTFHSFKTY